MQRYGDMPVRNARVNTMLARLVDAVGIEEAPGIARFYLTHDKRSYVAAMHPVKFLLADAEKLRTEWATGRKVSETTAVQADRVQAAGTVWEKLIEEAEAPEVASTPAPLRTNGTQWWEDDREVMNFGRQHGIAVIPGQPFDDLKARVFVAAGEGPWMKFASPDLRTRIEHWKVVGVNAPS